MSLLILVVDDEPDVEALFASNSDATSAKDALRWILRSPETAPLTSSVTRRGIIDPDPFRHQHAWNDWS
jgi:hypothetical protein